MDAEKLREYEKRMIDAELEAEDDQEMGHIHADEIVVEFLNELGYKKLAEHYDNVGKWYA